MPTPGSGDGGSDSIDELPLDSESDLPEELDLGDDVLAEGGQQGVPEEPELEASAIVGPHGMPDDRQQSSGEGVGPHDVAQDALEAPAIPEQVSIFSRRGRPNRCLQESLRDLLDRKGASAASLPGAGSSSSRLGAASSSMVLVHPPPHHAAELKAMVASTALSDKARGTLLREVVYGYCPLSPLTPAVQAAFRLVQENPAAPADPDIVTIGMRFLGDQALKLASKTVLSDILQVDRKKLDVAIPLLASTLLHSSQGMWDQLQDAAALRLPAHQRLMFLEFSAYDETPLPVQVKAAPSAARSLSMAAASQTAAPESLALATCTLETRSKLLDSLRSSGATQKVVQTFQELGMLLKIGDRLVGVTFVPVCPLVVLDRCTARALKELQLRMSVVSRAATCFGQACRLVCTDRYSANMTAERSIAEDRDGWLHLHTTCEVHRTAACYTKSFVLLDDNVKGMIHAALSLRHGAAMTRFRNALREEIASRFEVLAGSPPKDAQQHKRFLLQLFVNHGSALATRQVLLVLCPNGDWRAPKVQHYVAPGEVCKVDHSLLLERVTAGMITALAAKQPEVYPRHRWTGADLCTDQFGVLEACHRLLSTSFKRFVTGYEGGLHSDRRLPQPPQGKPAEASGYSAAGGSEAVPAPLAEEAALVPLGDPSGLPDGDSSSQPPGGGTAWAEVNALHRRVAAEWISSRPMAKLVLQRVAMEPLRQLLTTQFRVASDDWEQAQRAKVLEAAAQGDHQWKVRQYRIVLAASCIDENKCHTQLQALFREPMLWKTMPAEAYTVGFQALSFRLISRIGCCVQELLKEIHLQLPFALFRLLEEPGLAQDLLDLPECRWDAWSKEMRRSHPELKGEVFFAKLAFVAHLLWKDVSKVEARHATIRRHLLLASTQTHQQNIADLSAQWCFHQARKAGRARSRAPGSQQGLVQKVVQGATTAQGESMRVSLVPERSAAELAPCVMPSGQRCNCES